MLPQSVKKLYEQRAAAFRSVLSTAAPSRIESGQIWSTKGLVDLPNGRQFVTDEPRLIVIVEGPEEVENRFEQLVALPLSIEVAMASELDLIVPATESSLRFDFMIEVWNEVPVLAMQLQRFLGTLSPSYQELLQTLYVTHMIGEQAGPLLAGRVGYRLMGEEDVRWAFQEREIEALKYLAQAATAALGYLEAAQSATPALNSHQQALIPNVLPSWEWLLKRLEGIGMPQQFVRRRLVPNSLVEQAQSGRRSERHDRDLVTAVAEVASRMLKVDLSTLFSTAALQLEPASLATRFKKPKRLNENRAAAYTFYAHYLSLLVLQATPHIKPQPLPSSARELHEAVTSEYGAVTFDAVLRHAWSKGVAVLPLNDPGNFHGACWRVDYRNVIVIKHRSYQTYWLFDLLHELKHAADHPAEANLSVVDLDPDQEWLLETEEEEANRFAGSIMLNGRAERLVQACVEEAGHEESRLKRTVQRVANREGVRVDALANYLAYRLARDGTSWWSTAAKLQVTTGDPLGLARTLLLDHLDLDLLNPIDRNLLSRALEIEE